jgi:flagellar basal-body rod protein FlgC
MYINQLILKKAISAHAQKQKIAEQNLVNSQSLNGPNQNPYTRELVVFSERNGIMKSKVIRARNPYEYSLDPTHPFANEKGFVLKPKINKVIEGQDRSDAMQMKNTLFKIISNSYKEFKRFFDNI